MKKEYINLYLAPLVFALVAIAHDMNYIQGVDLLMSCLKDFVFIFLMSAVALHLIKGSLSWISLSAIVVFSIVFTAVFDGIPSMFLPDSWISTQVNHMGGFPLIELIAISVFIWMIAYGLRSKIIKSSEAAIYAIIFTMIILSARFSHYHIDYLVSHPAYSWSDDKETVSVDVIDAGEFVAHEWMLRNADYMNVEKNLNKFFYSSIDHHFWWGTLLKDGEQVLMRIDDHDDKAILKYQHRVADWDGDMKWTPVGFLSIVLLFFASFLSANVFSRALTRKNK